MSTIACVRPGGWSSRWPGAVVFVAVPVLLSNISGSVAFAVNPNTAADIGMTRVAVPWWVFVAAWVIIDAGMGLAAWELRRTDGDACLPLALLAAGYVQTNLFWLSDGLRSVAAADATGLLFATVTTWAFARQSRAAARWLVPWLVWMPVTLAVKLVALAGSS